MAISKEEAKGKLSGLFNDMRGELDEDDFLDLVSEFADVCEETLEEAGYWDDELEDVDADDVEDTDLKN